MVLEKFRSCAIFTYNKAPNYREYGDRTYIDGRRKISQNEVFGGEVLFLHLHIKQCRAINFLGTHLE
jgi:hypothetical protein